MALSFVTLGIGDAFSAMHYSSCLAVFADGAWLLVDCPHPIRKMMHESQPAAGCPLDVDRIAAVALTHLHADHSSGLEGFAYFSYFALGRPAKLAVHPDVSARLWAGHLAAGMEQLLPAVGQPFQHRRLEDYFELIPLAVDRAVSIGPFTIESRMTIHHIPTTALRIRAGGRTLGVSADTAFDPSLLEWLSAADLIVHETNFGVHTPYEKLAALPAGLRTKMRLIHYPDGFDLEASAIEPLRQGLRYDV